MNGKTGRKRLQWFIVHLPLVMFCILCVIPILALASISLSSMRDIADYGYRLVPVHIDFQAYRYIFNNPGVILNAYAVSITVMVMGTVFGMIVNSLIAYPLSRLEYRLRRPLTFFVFFPLLFSGGLVPWYILISQYLKLKDTVFALVLPYVASSWNILLFRTYFSKIPRDILEYARIDGAHELYVFWKIVVPLSVPSFATVGFLTALIFWNDWFLAMLFIEKNSLLPLQSLLQRIMSNIEFLTTQLRGTMASTVDTSQLPSENARMAMCVLAAGPMLFAFQYFQKYFVKGLTVGSLKG